MRAALFLSVLALAAQAAHLPRHGDDMDGMDMAMDEVHNGTPPVATPSLAEAITATSSAHSPPSSSAITAPSKPPAPAPAHGHGGHHHSGPVREKLDDAEVHRIHSFPPTYLDADFRLTNDSAIFGEDLGEDWHPESVASHPGLMVAHVAAMMLAYFAFLPIALALRAAGHPSHYLANAGFLVVAILGWLAGVAYKAAMPDMYPGAKHGSIGGILVLTSIGLGVLDSLGLITRAVGHYRSGNRDWRSFFREALQTTKEDEFAEASRYEMVDVDERQPVFSLGDEESEAEGEHSQAMSRRSTGSEGTLQDTLTPTSTSGSASFFEMTGTKGRKHQSRNQGAYDHHDTPRWTLAAEASEQKMTARRLSEIVLTWIRRTQVVVAYAAVCTGITIYVGMCRAGFINTCAAHIIKGSIFFGYGVLTFARYLGAYADLGWAWNRRPAGSKAVSAEMVECAVIFTYGITNTWMERFGAKHGDPYTVKQVQHISIAVMFWFAGLGGMLLESKRVRKFLASAITTDRNANRTEPPTYAFSFNPLPGLVIAVTGLAMAAHHQDYVFQVSIHSLWGLLLAGGSAFRFLTYFFLWLRPPTESTLPSRPPTEVLTSFGWAAGGIVFMLSDEEVAFAAMRSGYDDVMAFLNFTVALTCLIFCWIVVVLAVKGYALLRVKRGVQLEGGDEETRV